MNSDQMNRRTAGERVVWDQYFCAALIAESNLTAPTIGGSKSSHDEWQSLLVDRARILADKMMEHRQ
ncbi:hypothetical protein C1Y08_28965 [Pseudomonas sp. FW306-02-F02-AA]|jgi:hypothetical protein|uniref:Uncharacterized protein n=1 Tax=Pseudomonas fluorescens TaxID=294 RepID=A0A0N9WL74_PSEFL|nr:MULTISPECIES: hypothetical protein [Pseudomonas]ALI03385.1 hypothetical protein AO353_20770 [Pseudomonas fluorescens]PMZ00728.1 hypothetical protein C1Y07_28990 [Pseudomonas sp. FW306-02-F02-AB]PMZ06577.1 hypothetical protein C1Y06_29225 [Pseudomonas sp. FW306-02-H06C]PMZ12482.1 hypothetical protein C1Y08_28965 [Pseudomonas sp. FW306-02-F02-AA]PMZ18399.1 hypothetical protein C1Y09_29625 [Pseudomonas sp. FW306-02-F08-AA]